ncbi:MAG TPA: glycosyltransferase family 4 protein [Candidatus Acidoferrales bacterium]|nr:glycosyltransferase family 4 protein [Candidatus Acidoferrales bacterium]
MHILLLNEYYPPDSSATAKMARTVVEALAERHRVTVLAGRPSYDPTEHYAWRLLRRETVGNVTVERVGSTDFPRFRMKRRIANYLTFSFLAFFRAIFIRCDAILAMTDPPFCGIIGALVATLTGRPFVYNIRDMYPDMAVGGSIVRPGLLARLWERLHRWALRRAACVIVLGDDMRDRIVRKGIDPARIVVARDGIEIPREVPAADNPVAREIRGDARFVALHAGNLGFYGAWDTLLAAASMLGSPAYSIIFVGEGAEKPRLVSIGGGLASVRFLPFRPASEIPFVLSAADVHIVTVKRGLEGVIVPSKLYPILAAGRPVLAVCTPESDVARIVSRAGCGLVADPDDPAAVASAIRELASDRERIADMGRRASAIAPEYDRVTQLHKFILAIEEAVLHA